MAHLPWLVVHGMLAWRLALGAAALAGLAIAWALPRLAARRDARRERARIGGARTPRAAFEEGAIATVGGVLRAGGQPCERFEDGAPAAAAAVLAATGARATPRDRGLPAWVPAVGVRAERLVLVDERTGEPLVELLGPLELLVGSRDVLTGQQLSQRGPVVRDRVLLAYESSGGDPSFGRPPLAEREVALRSLYDGDRVAARGVLRREAATDTPGSYRGANAIWTLVPEAAYGATGSLRVAAEGAPAVVGPSRSRLAAFAVSCAVAFMIGSSLAGELALRLTGVLFDEGVVQVAAVSPLQRTRALEVISAHLGARCRYDPSRAQAETTAAIAELRDDPAEAARALMRHGLLDRAAAVAERRAPRVAARAEYLRGHFEAASGALDRAGSPANEEDALFEVRVYLLAGRVEAAAKAAIWGSHQIQGSSPDAMRRATALRCVADALEARLSDGKREAYLREPSGTTSACWLLRADLLRGKERLRHLDGPPARTTWDQIADLLAIETELGADGEGVVGAGSGPACADRARVGSLLLDHPSYLFGGQAEILSSRAPGLEWHALYALDRAAPPDSAPGPCARLSQLAVPVASFAALTGDAREARRWAEVAVAASPAGAQVRASAFRAAIEIYTGDLSQARALLDALPESAPSLRELAWLADVREGHRVSTLPLTTSSFLRDPRVQGAWQLVVERDGAHLASFLQHHDDSAVGAFLPAAAQQAQTGRGELLEWLRWGDRSSCWSCAPALVGFDAASRRDAADALGDRALAGDAGATAEAFRHALGRRELAVPLAVLEVL